jgi:opacity protein-like surface antigen
VTGPAGAADGGTRRFAIIAGANLGGPGRTPLRYATSDARDVARVLRRLGGVTLDDLVLVEEPDAARLQAALARVASEAERTRGAGGRVELFLYYSGHSDEEGLLLGGSRLSYADLRRQLDRVPADVRVAILDSCSSGAITRAKGGVHRPPFLLDASSHPKGHAFLTSSAADEAAQESDRLRASFFTHALLSGLRGAADASGDGVVTLNEAYQFAFRETLAGTETAQAGPQHATYDIGLVGSGDVVMTDLRRADAMLVVPEPIDGRVFVRNASGQLVAELRKARGARLELALEEGRHEVRVTRDRKVLAATVTLSASARLVLDAARLWPVALETTAARGAPGPADVAFAGASPDASASHPDPAPPEPAARASQPDPAPSARGDAFRYALLLRGGPSVSMRPQNPAGFHAELAAEAWGWEILGLEFATGYGRIAGSTTGRMPGAYEPDVKDTVTTVPGALTVKLGFPAGRVHPYLLGGAGFSWVRVDRSPARDYAWLWPQGDRRLHDQDLVTTAHVGAGAGIAVSRNVRAQLEVRFTFGNAELLQAPLHTDNLRLSAGLGYSF